ncbi:uncharacterized protein JCM6883_003364 [Sporobolomyces salmoneus]|uniref:uncharacterized protein n=1 Tax=Sporobolomyces salmoneus TaxID=183962 RepID=UPI00317C3679
MPGLQQLSPYCPFSPSYSRRSPSPLALPSPSPCRHEQPKLNSMAQFTNPYASMQVPSYTNADRVEMEELHDLNFRSFQQMGRQLSMDGLEVQLRAKDSMEKAALTASLQLQGLPTT